MNTTYRHVFSGRRMNPGIAVLATILFFLAQLTVRCAEIVVTVTGEVDGGTGDFLHIFGTKRNINGTPFTAVFTFDDAKGKPLSPYQCDGSATGAEGSGADSPGTAVLTMGGKSSRTAPGKTATPPSGARLPPPARAAK